MSRIRPLFYKSVYYKKEIIHMEKINTTEKKSNKKTFSKEPVHNTSEFQVENMKHKIQSVKKKKKLYNYKNIEQLKNIHDDVTTDPSSEPIIEGLPTNPIAKFKEDDFEGGKDDIYERETPPPKQETPDEDKDESDGKSTKEKIGDFFLSIDAFGDKVVETLIRSFSVEKVYENDKKIVKEYVYSFFAIFAALYLTTNLCITMFLRIDGKRLGIAEYDPYDKNFDTSNFATGYPVFYRYTEEYIRKMKEPAPEIQKGQEPQWNIPHFLLAGPLFLADSFGSFVESAPKYLTDLFNVNALYLMIFMFAFFMARHGVAIMQSIVGSTMKGDFENPYVYIPLIGILWVFAMSFSSMSESRIELLKSNTYFLIAWGIMTILQLIMFIFLGPLVGVMLFAILFLILSTVSMWFYADWNISKAFQLVNELNKMVTQEMRDYEMPEKSNCRKTGFFSDIAFYINRMAHFSYNNLHYLSFIVLFGVACSDYYANMKSERLKNMLIPFTFALMIGLSTLMDNPFAYIFQTAESLY